MPNQPGWWKPGGKYNKDRYDKTTSTFTSGPSAGMSGRSRTRARNAEPATRDRSAHGNDEFQQPHFQPPPMAAADRDPIPDEPMEPDLQFGIGSAVGGTPNAPMVAARTIQRYQTDVNQHGTYDYTFETTLNCMQSVTAGASGVVTYIPWESLNACHGAEQLNDASSNAWFWKPKSARVELYDFKAHAEIPINATAHYPIELNQIRARFLKQGEWLGVRSNVIDSLTEFNAWNALLSDQQDGTAIKELPKTQVYKGYSDTAKFDLEYDDDEWVDKRIVDDEMFAFDWSGSGPWRHGHEFYTNIYWNLKQPPTTTTTVWKCFSFPRFDYLDGRMDFPTANTKEDALEIPVQSQVCNIDYSPIMHSWHRSFQSPYLYDAYNNRTTNAHVLVRYGKRAHYVPDDADQGERYQDSNLMKPILLNFSRFMNGDDVQPYRVYFKIRIIHKVTMLKNLKVRRNISQNANPMGATLTKSELGKVPWRIFSGHHADMDRPLTDIKYKTNSYSFPIYNPKLFLTWHATS